MSTRVLAVRASRSPSSPRMEILEDRRLLAFTALIDFQPPNVPTQSGYQKDTGAVFGSRGNGLTYGWNATNNNGTSSNAECNDISLSNLASSVGVGVTWVTALGPLSFALAMPIKKPDDAETQVFQFSLGQTF